ncbi:MAG: HAMP domain-containing sensor histidine kinase [Candidatus Nitrosocosmicus sp.]
MIKIGILSITQILFIVIIFGILIYLQSQQTLLGNTINIAGKNRYLTTNIIYQISEYLGQSNTQSTTTTTTITDENKRINYNDNISKIKVAEQQIDSNIIALKNGGNISDIQLQPIPSEFMNTWNVIYQKWQNLKSALDEQIYKNSQDKNLNFQNMTSSSTLVKKSNDSIKQKIYPLAFELINLSDTLVTQLGQYAKKNMDNLVLLQFVFGSMNVLLILFILHVVSRMLKPVFLLTKATFEVKKGNMDVSVNYGGNDEISFLILSFNSMIETIKSDIKKQTELTNQLRLLNSQLKVANKANEDFINAASHELRSPIQSIIGSVSLLLGKTKELQQQQKLYEIVYRNSKKLKILIQNLLDIPKIESKSLSLNKERFYVNELLMNIIKDYQNTYRSFHNYKFIFKNSENNDFLIYADKNRITQVIYNLVENSIKFVEEDGIVSIISEKKKINGINGSIKEFVIIHVKDTGSGIEREMMHKIFTKISFKSEKGIGLGLYISKNIIEAHDGNMWAKNNNEDGKGATFSFSLPSTNDCIDKKDDEEK